MEPVEYLALLRKHWLLLVILSVLGGGAGFAQAETTPPSYRAESKVFVSVDQGASVVELVQGANFAQNLVQSYAQLVTMPVVLQPVIDELDLDVTTRELSWSLKAETPLNTVIIVIRAVSGDPVRAANISNAVAEQLAKTVDEISPKGADGESSIVLRVVSPASVPQSQFAPNVRFSTATGLLVGALVGFVTVLLSRLLDNKVRTDADVADVSPAAVLGAVPAFRGGTGNGLVMRVSSRSSRAEAYRRIRANLQFVGAAVEIRSLVVTSARAGEGKTTTAVNLALAVAERHSRVLVIDADLRRPRIAEVCGLEGAVGLTSVLIGTARADDVIQPWGDTGVSVMTAGAVPPNPLQLIESSAMAGLIEELEQSFDFIIIDSPPVLPVADSAVLSKLATGAVFVASAGKTTRQQLRRALESFDKVGASVVGIVLARVGKRESDAYYGYGYQPIKKRRRTSRRRSVGRSSRASGAGFGDTQPGAERADDFAPRMLERS